jgi:AcrR family transcriptional regulator
MSSTPRPSGRRPYAARLPLEERRSQILDAALAIIVREGYEAVTISAVAAEEIGRAHV